MHATKLSSNQSIEFLKKYTKNLNIHISNYKRSLDQYSNDP